MNDLVQKLGHALWRECWDAPRKRSGRGYAGRTFEEQASGLLRCDEFITVCHHIAATYPMPVEAPAFEVTP